MASAYKRGKRWYASWKEEDGLWKSQAVDAHDKSSAMNIARKRETQAALIRDGLADPARERLAKARNQTIESHLSLA